MIRINLSHYWGKLATMQHVRISLITKKLYSTQNRFWHENVEKGLAIILEQINHN